MHNCVTELYGIRWQYDVHGRAVEKDGGQTCYRYDPRGRRISKISQQLSQGRLSGKAVTTRFVWEGYRSPTTTFRLPIYVYSDIILM